MAESSQTIFTKISEKLKAKKFGRGFTTPRATHVDLEELLSDVVTVAHSEYPKVSADRDDLLNHVRSSIINDNSDNTFHRLKDTMAGLEARNEIYFDQHEQLKKIENGQAKRALFWRATTTFTIALIIFFFYWLAHYTGIPMPLSRVGL